MGLFSMKSLALKWSFLFFLAGEIVFIEYFNLYMKQLGLSTSQIGFTTLFGLLQLSAPMCAFLGDRFRARKLIFAATTAVLFLTTLGPLLPIVVSLPTCFGKKNESSINQASHLSKDYYLQGTVNTSRSLSFNGSRNPFLLPSNETPTFNVDKILTSVEDEARHYNNVPWLSTLFILMVMCRAFSLSTSHVFSCPSSM